MGPPPFRAEIAVGWVVSWHGITGAIERPGEGGS